MKYSHIDEAEQHIHRLSSQLRELKKELSDISDTTGINLGSLQEISSGQRAIDFWFDNIFTNLSVRGKIIDNASQVKSVLQKTERLHSQLENKLNQTKTALADNRQREENFIAELQ
jgi:chromosome segregation ATPase